MTHYQLLQVTTDASTEIIDAAWKAQMRKYHPDNGTEPNAQMAVLVNLAHDILSDPKLRKQYDQSQPHPAAVPFPGRSRGRAYPSPYEREIPIAFNVQEMLEQALAAAGQATIQHVMDTNPALKNLIATILENQKRRAG